MGRVLRIFLCGSIVAIALAPVTAQLSAAAIQTPPVPAIVSVRISHASLPASGGTTMFEVRSRNGTLCRLALNAPEPAPVAFSRAWRPCRDGFYRVSVSFGVNTSSKRAFQSFRVLVRRGGRVVSRTEFVALDAPAYQESPSWAGYVWRSPSQPIQGISATWTVPTLTCGSTSSVLDAWVGVDGATSDVAAGKGEVLQAGSSSDCLNGAQQNLLWWEWYPTNGSQTVGTANAGDVVYADVWYATISGQSGWWWFVEDMTTGESSTNDSGAPVAYTGPAATGEWIVEDPGRQSSEGFSSFPSSFTPVTFSSMTLGPVAWGATVRDVVDMVQSGQLLARAAVPTDAGGPNASMTVSPGGS